MEGWDSGRVYGSQFSRQDVDRLNHLPSHLAPPSLCGINPSGPNIHSLQKCRITDRGLSLCARGLNNNNGPILMAHHPWTHGPSGRKSLDFGPLLIILQFNSKYLATLSLPRSSSYQYLVRLPYLTLPIPTRPFWSAYPFSTLLAY